MASPTGPGGTVTLFVSNLPDWLQEPDFHGVFGALEGFQHARLITDKKVRAGGGMGRQTGEEEEEAGPHWVRLRTGFQFRVVSARSSVRAPPRPVPHCVPSEAPGASGPGAWLSPRPAG